MIRRGIIAVLLLGLLGLPLLLPFAEVVTSNSWSAWAEVDRVAELVANTVGLCALTLLFALPLGVSLAVLLYRTDLPGRRFFRSVLLVALFIPLPVFALAWQSAGGGGWRPWTQGLLPAAMIHAAAALPWVVWLTGLGLSRVEPELEEDALTVASAGRVFWRVSLRRAAPAIGLAVVWVVLQAAGEITVTDLTVVRTFAEEVYTQFVAGGPDGLGRAVAVSLPATLVAIGIVGVLVRRWEGRLAVAASARPPLTIPLLRAMWPLFAIVLFAIAGYVGVPIVSLVVQAGGGEDGSIARFVLEVWRAVSLHTRMIVDSLLWATAAGVLAAGIALVASWIAVDSRWSRRLLFGIAVALWAVPGPILGFGLKEAIDLLMDLEDVMLAWTTTRPVRAVLYELSTPIPVLWAHVARLFPYAVAIVWPAVRDVPRDLREAARSDGATPWGEFRHVIWPATRSATGVAVVAVAALALGELAASKLVQVPGRQTFAQELFMQMHYAATSTTAALALVQLVVVVVLGGAIAWWSKRISHRV
jgi:iron(III) transport system permease protein